MVKKYALLIGISAHLLSAQTTKERKILNNLIKLEVYIQELPYSSRRQAMDLLHETMDLIEHQSGHNIHQKNDLTNLLNQLKRTAFDDDKLKILQQLPSNNLRLSVEELAAILRCFTFDGGKAKALKWGYPLLTNPLNAGILADCFMSPFEYRDAVNSVKG